MKTIFIISPTRSGSTLLWKMLSQHKEISSNLTESFVLFPLLHGQFDNVNHLTPIPKKVYQQRAQAFIDALPRGQKDYDEAFQDFIMTLYKKQNGDNTYCIDKSPGGYLFILENLLDTLPDHKFIFLFRNPLAIAASMSETFSEGHIPILIDNAVLNIGYEKMLKVNAQGEYNDQIHAVNYESLVTKPEETLGNIYDFLGLRYDDDDMSGWEDIKIKGMGDFWGEENYTSFSQAPLVKYKNFYTTPFRRLWAKKYINSLNVTHMKHVGYDPDALLESIKGHKTNWSLAWQDWNMGSRKMVRVIARRIGQGFINFAASNTPIKQRFKKQVKKIVSPTRFKKHLVLFIVKIFKFHDTLRGIQPKSFTDLSGTSKSYLDNTDPDLKLDRGNYLQVFPYDFTVEAKNCRLSRYSFYSDQKFRLCFGEEKTHYAQVQVRNFTANTLKSGFFLHNFMVTPKLFLKNFITDRFNIILKRKPDHNFENAIIINSFWKAYGHFIHDSIPMIDQAIHELPKQYPAYKDAPIILMADPAYHLPLLTKLGYDPDRFVFLQSHESMTVKSALFHLIGSRDSKDVANILKRVKTNVPKPKIKTYKRIFIDRKNANGRILKKENRRKIFSLLEKYDIQDIVLENHKFEEQIALMNDAELIVGWHGSGMANLHLTSKPKKVVILYETYKDYRLQNAYDKILPAHIDQDHLILSTRNVREKRLEARLNEHCAAK